MDTQKGKQKIYHYGTYDRNTDGEFEVIDFSELTPKEQRKFKRIIEIEKIIKRGSHTRMAS